MALIPDVVSVYDAHWKTVGINDKDVIEVFLGASNLVPQSDSWAGFFVLKRTMLGNSTMLVNTRFMYCEDQEATETFNRTAGGGEILLHLCGEEECLLMDAEETKDALHVTQIRIWKYNHYVEHYGVGDQLEKAVKEWLNPPKVPKVRAPRTPKAKAATAKAGDVGDGRRRKTPPAGKEATRKRKPSPEAELRKKLTTEQKERLREKLSRVRDGQHREQVESAGVIDVSSGGSGERSPSLPLEIFSPVQDAIRDTSPMGLRGGAQALAFRRGARVTKPRKENKTLALATKDITSKGPRGDLLRRAVEATNLQREKKRKKEKKSNPAEKVAKALTELVQGFVPHKVKKEKKSKKEKKGEPSSPSGSSDSSSTGGGKRKKKDKDSSEEDLEAPMKKRSRDKPGSVLEMLTDHVREKLEQTAATDPVMGENSVTGGVRIMTYFSLHLKQQFGTHTRELRELYHLAASMDLLRQGDIARTGDALAARFMSIHQSMLDSNWGTARFMEIFPMEEQNSSSTSMLLATRKHAKMITKMQNPNVTQNWNIWGRGRGKGGGSNWYSNENAKGDGKGKGKGKKGKDSNKGKWSAQGDWNQEDWKNKKEKEGEKKT